MKSAIVLMAFATLAGAQQVGKDIQVPKSPSEVTLEAVAKDIRDRRQAVNDAFQQSRAELDKENKPLQQQIEALEYKMRMNQIRLQQRFNKISGDQQRAAGISQAQVPWLVGEVKKSAGLPETATFSVETGKWIVPQK